MHIDLFRDKTNLLKVRLNEAEGVYFRFSGDTQEEIFYLGAIPGDAKVEEAMDLIFADLGELERGIAALYGPSGCQELFYGGVMTFYGMHTLPLPPMLSIETKQRRKKNEKKKEKKKNRLMTPFRGCHRQR